MTTLNNWGNVANKINSVLTYDLKTIEVMARESGLDESTVRNFLPLSKAKQMLKDGNTYYILDSAPKKLSIRQMAVVVLEITLLTTPENPYMKAADVGDAIRSIRPDVDKDAAIGRFTQLYQAGHIGRRGTRGSFEYCSAGVKGSVNTVTRSANEPSMAEQLISIAEKVEPLEIENKELHKKVNDLTCELNRIKKNMQQMLGGDAC